MLNLENFLFGVLGPEGGSSSVADMLTRGLSLADATFSSSSSESLTPPYVVDNIC